MKPEIVHEANQYPFLKILVLFLAGILLEDQFQVPARSIIGLFLSISSLIIFFNKLPINIRYRYGLALTLFIQIQILSMGMLALTLANIRIRSNWFDHFSNDKSLYLVQVREPWSRKKNSYRTIAEVKYVVLAKQRVKTTGLIWLYHERAPFDSLPELNEIIFFKKKPTLVRNFEKSGSFDFEKYSARRNIYHQVYLKTNDYRKLNVATGNLLSFRAHQMRTYLIGILDRYIPGKQEKAVSEALLLGYRDNLERELLDNYSQTGVIHIIAISGLHLGLIYGILLLLLKPFRKLKSYNRFRLLIILPSLWSFWLITGMTASVSRSALMFSFVIGGDSFNRKIPALNSLACAAFFILAFHPRQLWNPGFQLSFMAVSGIMALSRPIEKMLYLQNPMASYLWKLVSVSLAAQIFTFPIVLYHFHQFSYLFLFANLVAVPLAGIILSGELLVCLLAAFPYPAGFIGRLTGNIIHFLNGYIEKLGGVPFASGRGIIISPSHLILIYFLLLAAVIWIRSREPLTRENGR